MLCKLQTPHCNNLVALSCATHTHRFGKRTLARVRSHKHNTTTHNTHCPYTRSLLDPCRVVLVGVLSVYRFVWVYIFVYEWIFAWCSAMSIPFVYNQQLAFAQPDPESVSSLPNVVLTGRPIRHPYTSRVLPPRSCVTDSSFSFDFFNTELTKTNQTII